MQLGVNLDSVDQRKNPLLRSAIWNHSENLEKQEVHISLEAENAKTIWNQLRNYLPLFALFKSDRTSTDQDDEAQDPMKLAIKDAIQTEKDEINKIVEVVTEKVKKVAERTVEKVKEMDPELASQLEPKITTKPWHNLFSVKLTDDEKIPINKRGSGTRRLVLINFFRAKAEEHAEGSETGIIYAVEEPETTQHPRNQVMLVKALSDLAEQYGNQVLLSTHSPILASRFKSDSLRYITNKGSQPSIRLCHDANVMKEIVESLGILPDHNIKAFFGVEGGNDITFLRIISKILCEHDIPEIPDLGCAEDNGQLFFVPFGGSNLGLWVSRLESFRRPEFYLVDSDKNSDPKVHKLRERENCIVWVTIKGELENYIHPEVIKSCCPRYKGNGSCLEDVPELLAQANHEASESNVTRECVKSDTDGLKKKVSKAKKKLNSEIVTKMTPDLLKKIDPEDELIGWLREIGRVLQDNTND